MFTLFSIDLGCDRDLEFDLERDLDLLSRDLDLDLIDRDRGFDLNVIPTLFPSLGLLSLFLLLFRFFPFLDIFVLVRLTTIF